MERNKIDSASVPHGTGNTVDAAEHERAGAAAKDPMAPVRHIPGDVPMAPVQVETTRANSTRSGYMLRLWGWMGMGQCGFIVGAVLGVGSLVLVGESSFVTDWWIVLAVAALAWLGPPVFYTPPGSKTIAPAYSSAHQAWLSSTGSLNAAMTDLPGSASTAVAIISVAWRVLVFSKSILGFIAGVASGGIVLLVSTLVGPDVGLAVAAAILVVGTIVVFARRRSREGSGDSE